MRVAIVGSRTITDVDISQYIPKETMELVSGGADGIDSLAEAYADANNIPKLILKPEYNKYGKSAPLKRNETIVDLADYIVVVWDGKSRGSKHVIDYAKKKGKPVQVFYIGDGPKTELKVIE